MQRIIKHMKSCIENWKGKKKVKRKKDMEKWEWEVEKQKWRNNHSIIHFELHTLVIQIHIIHSIHCLICSNSHSHQYHHLLSLLHPSFYGSLKWMSSHAIPFKTHVCFSTYPTQPFTLQHPQSLSTSSFNHLMNAKSITSWICVEITQHNSDIWIMMMGLLKMNGGITLNLLSLSEWWMNWVN